MKEEQSKISKQVDVMDKQEMVLLVATLFRE
jgi:hypothetical protein